MKVENLSCFYIPDHPILQRVNFEIKKGGHLCILGSNGSGKSTLAKALCSLLPYQGSIQFDAHELRDIDANTRAKLITYIPAKMNSFDQFTTVADFVLMGRFPYKSPYKDYAQSDRDIVRDILDELTLSELSDTSLHSLSSGQQQLVLIAQALAQESDTLIFDEPTANLDPKNTLAFIKELKKLQKKHTTIVITHDIKLAQHLDHSVVFVDQGSTQYFEKDFFTVERLSALYGVTFSLSCDQVDVVYG